MGHGGLAGRVATPPDSEYGRNQVQQAGDGLRRVGPNVGRSMGLRLRAGEGLARLRVESVAQDGRPVRGCGPRSRSPARGARVRRM